jgi:hypothetical protein
MKAELPDDAKKSGDSTGTSTPDTASVAGSSTVALDESTEGSSDETLQTSAETISTSSVKKGKQKAQDAKEDSETSSKKKHSSADNLVGKINNLVTTDLSNITEGRDFLMAGKSQPLQVDVCFLTCAFVQYCTSHFRSSCPLCSCTIFSAGGWCILNSVCIG